MPKFSRVSRSRLATCHPDLQKIMAVAIQYFDFKVISGSRTVAEQREKVENGFSKTMNSKHVSSPSQAVDIAPWPIDWNDTRRFIYLAGHVKAIAASLGTPLIWGGDCDNDTSVSDNRIND